MTEGTLGRSIPQRNYWGPMLFCLLALPLAVIAYVGTGLLLMGIFGSGSWTFGGPKLAQFLEKFVRIFPRFLGVLLAGGAAYWKYRRSFEVWSTLEAGLQQ